MQQEVAAAGILELPNIAGEFNRLVMWSIEEYFESGGQLPNLPPFTHPDTGKPLQTQRDFIAGT